MKSRLHKEIKIFVPLLVLIIFVFSLTHPTQAEIVNNDYSWTKTVGGTGLDETRDIASDSSGNVYIAGEFRNTVDFDPGAGTDNRTSNGDDDFFLSKYNSDGTYVWTKATGGTSADTPSAVAVDSGGSVYVTGTFGQTVDFDPGAGTDNRTSNGSQDVFLTKYNSDGSYAWTKAVGGTSGDYVSDIAIDSGGNLHIIGWFASDTVDFDPGAGTDNQTSAGFSDIFISKYLPDGTYVWTKRIGGIERDYSRGITIDASNSLIITGTFNGTVDFDLGAGTDNHTAYVAGSIYIAKYNSDGSYAWTKTFGGSGLALYDVNDVTSNSSGNIFIVGWFEATVDFDPGAGTDNRTSNGDTTDFFLSKYNSDGTYAWTKTLGGTGWDDWASSVSVDNDGYIYISGSFSDTVDFDPNVGTDNHTSVGSSDIFLSKYNPDDTYAWTKTFGSSARDSSWSVHTISETGDVYFSGYYQNTVDFDPGSGVDNHTSNGQRDVFLSKYTTTYLQQITGIPAGVSAKTVSGTDVTQSGPGIERNTTSTVRLSETSTGTIYADVDTTFSDDLNWSGVSMGSDSTSGKAFVHGLASVSGTAATFTLYVPYFSEQTQVGICPEATSLAQVNETCTGLYYLEESANNVSISTVSGKQYWVITGLDSTGGFGTTGLADTGEDTTPLYIVAVLLISIGIVSTLWYLKYFNRS